MNLPELDDNHKYIENDIFPLGFDTELANEINYNVINFHNITASAGDRPAQLNILNSGKGLMYLTGFCMNSTTWTWRLFVELYNYRDPLHPLDGSAPFSTFFYFIWNWDTTGGGLALHFKDYQFPYELFLYCFTEYIARSWLWWRQHRVGTLSQVYPKNCDLSKNHISSRFEDCIWKQDPLANT